jgi:hypothetical protein
MHGFDGKIVFDPLNKRQSPDGDRFRPAIFGRERSRFPAPARPIGSVLFENLSHL